MDNRNVEMAIEGLHANLNQDSFSGVMFAFLEMIEQEGQLIVPVETPTSLLDSIDIEHIKPGDVITTPNDIPMKLQRIQVDEDIWLAAFTSEEEVKKGAGTSTITQSVEGFFRAVLRMPGVSGVIINPWDKSFNMNKEVIGLLLATYEQS